MEKNQIRERLQKCLEKCESLPDQMKSSVKAGQMGCDHVSCCHDTLDKSIAVVDSVLEHLCQCPNDNPDQGR